jgi:hypothetical protein
MSKKPTVSTSLWRALISVLVLATVTLVLGDLLHFDNAGTFGFDSVPGAHASDDVVDTVTAGSPAARAGIMPGDLVAPEPSTFVNRVRFYEPNAVGDTLGLRVTHASRMRAVRLEAVRKTKAPQEFLAANLLGIVYELLRVVLVAFALLIAVRRPERSDARALATFLAAFGFGFVERSPWYPDAVNAALSVLHGIAVVFALEQLTRFAACFPQASAAGLRRWIARAAPLVLGIVVAIMLAAQLAFFTGVAAALPWEQIFLLASDITILWFLVAAAVAFVLGAREALPQERPRVRWMALSFGVAFSGMIPAVIAEQNNADSVVWSFFPLTLLAIPVGTTYAILRHRLLDIGFVINRALVFTAISAGVVMSFGLLEFFIGQYLVSLGHIGSILLQASLALALGLSMQRIHRSVDRLVDSLFFRMHHLAEAALRRLTREVAFIGDSQVLAERLISAVDRHALAQGSALYLYDGARRFVLRLASLPDPCTAIDVDDAAIVRLRAFREAVDFADFSAEGITTALPGSLLLPMLVRGELTGALACGAKRNLEAYAPDERATLAELALAAGMAFDALQIAALRYAVDRALAGDAGLETLRAARSLSGHYETGAENLAQPPFA